MIVTLTDKRDLVTTHFLNNDYRMMLLPHRHQLFSELYHVIIVNQRPQSYYYSISFSGRTPDDPDI